VLINVMRGGPGLGSIGPSQADYFQATKGHGHGDYRVPVLAPSTIDEAVALIADAFEIAERYRTPVMLLPDGVLGQAMEPVAPVWRNPPRIENDWELRGAAGRSPRVVRSLHLLPEDLEAHNVHLQAKYATIAEREVRFATESLEDAEIAVVAYGTAARVARTAIDRARASGLRVGLLRPISLWPFPSAAIAELAPRVRAILVVEMSAGQMVEDVRLAVEGRTPIFFHGRTGGMVPMPNEVLGAIRRAWAMTPERASWPHGNGWVAEPFEDAATDDGRAAAEPDPLSLIELAEWADLEGPIPEIEDEADPFRLLFSAGPEEDR
ncbi:MAG: transketolase C-terminal domain-containing protein, partial [Candidatus Limnocylindrales bacterium]